MKTAVPFKILLAQLENNYDQSANFARVATSLAKYTPAD